MLFADLGLSPALLKSLELAGYTEATPIQAKAIPPILAHKDVLGIAQTGTGKTAAFALPVLQLIADAKKSAGSNKSHIRCLVLVPTRELALQVNQSFNKYGRSGVGGTHSVGAPMRYLTIFGGVDQKKQVAALKTGIDILVATPGRLEDLQQQGHVDLSHVSLFILDEADQMLDMGFIVPIRRIAKTVAAKRQTLMFSATMPREIKQLASEMLKDHVEVSVAPAGTAAELVEQKIFLVNRRVKGELLRHYITESAAFKTLVFVRTKHGADRVARGLVKSGITAQAIHGNRNQSQRNRALDAFKKGDIAALVATDVAARGLHITDVSHVVNFDLPEVPETYVHRIGRTGRAGASGIAVSLVDEGDRDKLRAVERLLKRKLDLLPVPKEIANLQPEEIEDRPRRTDSTPHLRRNDDAPRSDFRDDRRPASRDDRAPSRDDRAPAHHRREPSRPQHHRGAGVRPAHTPAPAPARAHSAPHSPHPSTRSHAPSPRPHTAPHAKPAAHTKPAVHAPKHAPASRPHAAKPHHGSAGKPHSPHPKAGKRKGFHRGNR